MEIKGKVHCFFEQSGTFKNEFKKLGIPAEDYDIQNNFGETDPCQDLIVAFYPCIYFCEKSQMSFYLSMTNYRALKDDEKILKIIERQKTKNYRKM